MTIFLLSLGGFPPTAGFIGKWYIFAAAVERGHYWLAIIGVLTSVVSVFFYLRIVVMMYMTEGSDDAPARGVPVAAVAGLGAGDAGRALPRRPPDQDHRPRARLDRDDPVGRRDSARVGPTFRSGGTRARPPFGRLHLTPNEGRASDVPGFYQGYARSPRAQAESSHHESAELLVLIRRDGPEIEHQAVVLDAGDDGGIAAP